MRTASVLLICFLPSLGLQGEAQTVPVRPHFQFREPRTAGYHVEAVGGPVTTLNATARPQLLRGWPDHGSTNDVLFESRVVLQVHASKDLSPLLETRPLRLDRTITETTFILQAPDAWTALQQAQDLAGDPRVTASYPVTRRHRHLSSRYAPRPDDPLFFQPGQPQDEWQANLENRDGNALPLGTDLNVREAWALARGKGVLVAIADDGVELDHPDLIDRTQNTLHFNFLTQETNGMPSGTFSSHATAVAGLVAATSENQIGIAGVAPEAALASWVIFGASDELASEEAMMDMFQYQSNVVSVQNHSWGKVGLEQLRVGSLENIALDNAIRLGRSGLGVVMVRAAGNGREEGNDVNEDGYLADPRAVAVAAVRLDGQIARYSSSGACVLVAAPSGDQNPTSADPCLTDTPNIATTDRQGTRGYNRNSGSAGDYASGSAGFSGTSAATPQISGLVALILSANPGLSYRDVQQILIQAGRQTDLSDPTLVTNAAGFLVSHQTGFGIPDAGHAVALAQTWSNRPPVTTVVHTVTNSIPIPDDGLRLRVSGIDVPESLTSISALPGGGLHPDATLSWLPLTDVGNATEAIEQDLRGRVALIQRAPNFFCQKIAFAAQAGAALAVIYNNTGENERIFMVQTDRAAIPSFFISQNDGEALRDFLAAQPDAQLEVATHPATITFDVPETLQCEFVGVHLNTDHSARGDLRIVLTSPSGTKSVLQHSTRDATPGPSDWTYYSVQHFYESSAGRWTLTLCDENNQGTGSVIDAALVIRGVAITDADHDGLDDAWELAHFASLTSGPRDDSDADGYSNSREQVLGTDPTENDSPLQLDLSVWDSKLARLSWPSTTNLLYRVQIGSDSPKPQALLTNVPGRFIETECFVPYTNLLHQFFRIQAVLKGN